MAPRSGRQFARFEIVLGRDAEGVGDAVEKGEQCRDVYGLGNLVFLPADGPEFLNILDGGAVGGVGNELHIRQENSFRFCKARLFELALQNCRYALIGCSLNTQEVSVAVQSIRAPVQIGDIARDHFFVASRKMPIGEMNGVGELHYLKQKVRTCPETFDNAGNFLSP